MRKAVIVFLIKETDILLLHSYTDPTETNMFWQGVSGFIEKNEEPIKAAVREVEEELGIKVKVRDLSQKHNFEANDIEFTVFTTFSWQGEPKPLEQGIEELRWFSFDQLPLNEMHSGDRDWLPSVLRLS
jgi:8-oxo-dGTP pyrophosphatase MutT (NUDIX family)